MFGAQAPRRSAGRGDPAFKYSAHVTVSMTSGGVEVFINIEVKEAVDKLLKAIALKKPLMMSLRALRSGGFEIHVTEAQRSGPSGIVDKVAGIVAQLDPIVRLINEQPQNS
jgi:hypothetical protein